MLNCARRSLRREKLFSLSLSSLGIFGLLFAFFFFLFSLFSVAEQMIDLRGACEQVVLEQHAAVGLFALGEPRLGHDGDTEGVGLLDLGAKRKDEQQQQHWKETLEEENKRTTREHKRPSPLSLLFLSFPLN
jgi:hypothetical protein